MVNCMDDNELCDLSSLFDSNIYAEIETNDCESIEKDDKTSTKLCRKAILAAFDEFDEQTKTFSECILSKSSSEDEMISSIEKILYENDCKNVNENIENELASSSNTKNSKAIFSMISKSIMGKLKSTSTSNTECDASGSIEKIPKTIETETNITGISLASRLKGKLKIGIKLSMLKNLQNAVSS